LTEELPELKESMSVAQFKAIIALLAGEWTNGNVTVKDITTERLYTHSHFHGLSRSHLLTENYDGDIVLEQNDQSEKYQQRVVIEAAEVEPILRQLLVWHFAKAATMAKSHEFDNDPFGDDPDLRHEDGPSEDMGTPNGIMVFTFNGGGAPIVAVKNAPGTEEEEKKDAFTEGIENAYGVHPDDPPIIFG
jgi:hypothetical protein